MHHRNKTLVLNLCKSIIPILDILLDQAIILPTIIINKYLIILTSDSYLPLVIFLLNPPSPLYSTTIYDPLGVLHHLAVTMRVLEIHQLPKLDPPLSPWQPRETHIIKGNVVALRQNPLLTIPNSSPYADIFPRLASYNRWSFHTGSCYGPAHNGAHQRKFWIVKICCLTFIKIFM